MFENLIENYLIDLGELRGTRLIALQISLDANYREVIQTTDPWSHSA